MTIIISKPEYFRKNESNTVKISRDAIRDLPSVAGHFYFRKVKNWKHIVFNFFSIPENQIEVVLFDGQQSEPEGDLKVSPRARNEFQIDSIVLHDFDNGWLEIPREEIDISEFDFIFDSRYWQPALTVTLQNKSNANLSWTQVEETNETTEYVIYRKVADGEFEVLTTVTGDRTYTDTGLLPETTYTYKVEINDPAKYLPPTEEDAVTPTRPNTPQNLVASTTPGQVTLSWDAVAPIAGQPVTYRVYRSTTSNGQTTPLISDLTGTTFTDNNVVAGTTYYYKVKAYDGFESNFSNQAMVTPIGTFSITALYATSSSSVTAEWTSSAGATSYKLFYKKQSDSQFTEVSGVTSPRSVTGLEEAVPYDFFIRASNTYSSVDTSTETIQTPRTPSVPTNVAASSWEDSKSTITWDASSYATKYLITRSTSVGGTYTQIGESTSTSFVNTGISNGATYYYKIIASNVSGTLSINSQPSTAASGTPNVPTVSPNFSSSGYTASTVSLAATATTNVSANMVEKIELYLFNGSGTQIGMWASGAGVTSFTGPSQDLSRATPYFVGAKLHLTSGAVVSEIHLHRTMANNPTNLVASDGGETIQVTWTAGSGSGSYDLLRSTNSSMSSIQASFNTSGTSYIDTSAPKDITLYYAVRAWPANTSVTPPAGWTYRGGSSSSSSELSNIDSGIAYTPATKPRFWGVYNVPLANGIDGFGSTPSPAAGQVKLSMIFIEQSVQEVRVYNGSNLIDTIANPTLSNYSYDGSYRFFEKSYSGYANNSVQTFSCEYTKSTGAVSPRSNAVKIKMLADYSSVVPTVTSVGKTSVSFSWPAADLEGLAGYGYDIHCSTNASFTDRVGAATIPPYPATTGTVSGLNQDQTYYFRVQAWAQTANNSPDVEGVVSRNYSSITETPRAIPVMTSGSHSVGKSRFRTATNDSTNTQYDNVFSNSTLDPAKTYKLLFKSISFGGGTTYDYGPQTHKIVVHSSGTTLHTLSPHQELPNKSGEAPQPVDFYLIVSGVSSFSMYGFVPEPPNIAYHTSYVLLAWEAFELYEI